jgi:hypothetical protein
MPSHSASSILVWARNVKIGDTVSAICLSARIKLIIRLKVEIIVSRRHTSAPLEQPRTVTSML